MPVGSYPLSEVISQVVVVFQSVYVYRGDSGARHCTVYMHLNASKLRWDYSDRVITDNDLQLIIAVMACLHEAIVAAIGRATDRCYRSRTDHRDDRLV